MLCALWFIQSVIFKTRSSLSLQTMQEENITDTAHMAQILQDSMEDIYLLDMGLDT
jgi:hypothetical protein